ncbi:hypothetical protein G9F72_006420 [Clostridium estertheticum]|uniref:hypothetical protein n=1 Tax=Clostridium estertheticum TaxID=238834 RepID=UPI0013E96586|nr:hypothetical protein [Clostridium estertheticum]MBZ9685970.1 hypothetical protein [Clostridium estertheticum]
MKKVNKNDLFKQERIDFTYKSENGFVEFKLGKINHLKASKLLKLMFIKAHLKLLTL